MSSTMRAVVFKAPGEVIVEDRPVPQIQDPTDAIIRVKAAALCGSDLHFYRGHMKIPPGFIVGHEFTGVVSEVGSEVMNFNIGDEVVVPFTTACGNCFYCRRKQASRCEKATLFGNSAGNSIDGGQAEYVRVPQAPTTLVLAPRNIPTELLVLMADIFPTGYFAASRFLKKLQLEDREATVCVVIGAGPVGICAIATALTWCKTVFVIDPVPERLEEAQKLGAIPIQPDEDPFTQIGAATNGRGADVVMEIVGHPSCIDTAMKIVRPWGHISSVGLHTSDLVLPGMQVYGKNVTISWGRCPVRSLFEEALEKLVEVQDKVAFLCSKTMKLEEAPEAFRLFEQRKVHKVVLIP